MRAILPLALTSVFLCAASPAMAHERHDKSWGEHDLKGSYGFAAQGYFGANFDAATQMTTGAVAIRVGVYKFDGKGHCSIHSLANKAGLGDALTQDTDDCSYQVDRTGTGTVDAVLGGKTFKTFFVLVNDGKEFMFTRREGINNPADQGGASLVFAIAKRQ